MRRPLQITIMTFARRAALALTILGMLAQLTASSQPLLRGNKAPILPTPTGLSLLGESRDLRLNYFSQDTIDARTRDGIVSLIKYNFIVRQEATSRSTNDWGSIRSVLLELKVLDRTTRRPQVRVVKRDSIVQSSLDAHDDPGSGFSDMFLNTKLAGGDIIIIAAIQE